MRIPIYLLVLLLTLVSSNLKGNETIIFTDRIGNIHYSCTNGKRFTFNITHTEILATLTYRLCKEKNVTSPILIEIDHFDNYQDSIPGYVRIDSFDWQGWPPGDGKRNYGLIIHLGALNLNIEQGYNLISNVILRYDSLPKLHNRPKIDVGRLIEISSISPARMKQFMSIPIKEATFVYNSPVDINFGKRNQFPISFFYLHKQFHFYVSDSTTTPEELLLHSNRLISLVTQDFREIIEFKRNSWVFDTYNQFYVIGNNVPIHKRGPYNISGINPSDFYTMDHYENVHIHYFNMALNYQYLIFDKIDRNRRRAVLYIPELSTVISGYQKREDGPINMAPKEKRENLPGKSKAPFNWTIPMLLLSLLLAALILSLTRGKRSVD